MNSHKKNHIATVCAICLSDCIQYLHNINVVISPVHIQPTIGASIKTTTVLVEGNGEIIKYLNIHLNLIITFTNFC